MKSKNELSPKALECVGRFALIVAGCACVLLVLTVQVATTPEGYSIPETTFIFIMLLLFGVMGAATALGLGFLHMSDKRALRAQMRSVSDSVERASAAIDKKISERNKADK